jgi:hypothetical protein
MSYTKTTWVDEVLAGPERFDINDNVGTPIYADVQILLSTTVTIAGTSVNAANLNNIEDGIYNLSRGAAMSVKGVAGGAVGDVDDIAAATDGQALRRSGSSIGFGQIASDGIADGAVVAGKIATGGVSAAGQIAAGIIGSIQLASGAVTAGKIATGGISATAQLANDIVDDTKVGNRVVMATKRKGGSATDWYLPGTTAYTIGNVKIQCGSASWGGSPSSSGNVNITFPETYSYVPLVFAVALDETNKIFVDVGVPDINGFTAYWRTYDASTLSSLYIFWLAIGPE